MSFKVAEVYADITKKYILDSLNYQYRGKNFKFSDDLLTILESDFKRKAKNLDWLFQGKTRISLKPSADDIFKSLQNDKIVMDFITVAQHMDYGIDPQNFVDGYVIINKQQVKFHKVRELMLASKPPVMPKEFADRLTHLAVRGEVNKYRPESDVNTSRDVFSVGAIVINTRGLQVSLHPSAAIETTWKSSSSLLSTEHIGTLLNSSEVIMSLDLNDYITCSEGSFSSCMSMNSSSTRHLGWMMHFRSDFSVITFVHKKDNSFYKTGRTWTFLKLTEDCLPYARPFYKLSRVYGELNDGHIGVVDSYVQAKISENLGLKAPDKRIDSKAAHFGNFKTIASPNMQNTGSNYSGTGYFDWPGDSSTSWSRLPLWEYKGEYPVTPFTSEVYKEGPVCLFNFPDALDVEGNATTQSLFTNDPNHGISNVIGWNEKYKQFVICQATGARILLRDALEISKGMYINKEHAVMLLSGKTIEAVSVVETVAEVIPEVELADEDVVDF